jgi:hypothetical protein
MISMIIKWIVSNAISAWIKKKLKEKGWLK